MRRTVFLSKAEYSKNAENCGKTLDTAAKKIYSILHHAAIAQLVERRTENPYVVSSILTRGRGWEYPGLFFAVFKLRIFRAAGEIQLRPC